MFRKILIANRGARSRCGSSGPAGKWESSQSQSILRQTGATFIPCLRMKLSASDRLRLPKLSEYGTDPGGNRCHGCGSHSSGFGFLSENAKFAELCAKCNIAFIGPSAEIIHRMGNKSEGKKNHDGGRSSVVPGSKTPVYTVEEARKMAERRSVIR